MPDHDRRRRRHRTPSYGVRFFFLRPQGDRQVRPLPPEGAFRFMQQHRLRRIRYRVQPVIPQDSPGKAGTVHKKESP